MKLQILVVPESGDPYAVSSRCGRVVDTTEMTRVMGPRFRGDD